MNETPNVKDKWNNKIQTPGLYKQQTIKSFAKEITDIKTGNKIKRTATKTLSTNTKTENYKKKNTQKHKPADSIKNLTSTKNL